MLYQQIISNSCIILRWILSKVDIKAKTYLNKIEDKDSKTENV